MRRDYFGGWHARETLVETTSPVEQYLELCARTRQALEANRPADAVTEARAALGVLPRGIDAQRLLGLALLEVGEMRPSLNAFQSALAADPLDLASQVGLAEARERL
ncbi:MAG TPA: hypothetical protein VGW38_14335, partial [Chloroflexota bacterium]|nr:hypothetical protein [Chloroflexota bacterium]